MTVSDPAVGTAPGAVRNALGETAVSLRMVFGHRSLRRLQLALAGSMIGDWAYTTAVTVWAYGVGGAKAVGLWAAIRLFILAINAPIVGQFADKLPRKHVMITADIARFVLVSAAAICISVHTPSGYVFVIATLSSMVGSAFRPAQAAWLPSLADRPEQLTASNGVSPGSR